MDIKERMIQDIKDSLEAAQNMLTRGSVEIGRAQNIATQLSQANNQAQQLYGILYKEWAENK